MKAQMVFMIIIFLIVIGAIVGFVYYIDKITKDKEPLIGGCAGVSSDNLQECCDNWVKENGVFVIACVGEWEIKDNACSWKCGEAG